MKNLLNNYEDKNQNLEYVFKQIQARNYTVLPDTIATGIVLKIHYEGYLEEEGYEKGFLVLTPNSEIKEHTHINDIEKYTILTGNLSVNNEKTNDNICLIGEKHNINRVNELTVIKTLKIDKKLINNFTKKNGMEEKQKKEELSFLEIYEEINSQNENQINEYIEPYNFELQEKLDEINRYCRTLDALTDYESTRQGVGPGAFIKKRRTNN